MNRLSYLLFFMLFSASFILLYRSLSFDPKTGDEHFDKQLNQMNASLSEDITGFTKNVSTKYDMHENEISKLLAEMEPAEVLITLQLLTITAKPLKEVLHSYKKNHRKGWKAIAEDLGIRANTSEFRELKNIVIFNDLPKNDSSLSQR